MTGRVVLGMGRQSIVLADNSKFGCVSTAFLAPVDAAGLVITDAGIDPRTADPVVSVGMHLIVAGRQGAAIPRQSSNTCPLDPLASAVLTLREIREMASEMLEAQREWLPQFEGRSIKPTPLINLPGDVVPAEVPLDPAVSIAQPFRDVLSPKEPASS